MQPPESESSIPNAGILDDMYAETTPNEVGYAGSNGERRENGSATSNGNETCIHRQAVSPSLRPWVPGDAPAYEMKFLLDERQAREVESLLAPCLSLDPHSVPALGNAYRITTLYCETPEFDVFHGVGSHRRRKYRLRSYGTDPLVFLERKCKRGERVRKRRTAVIPTDLAQLSRFQPADDWSGVWFHRQLIRRRLSPICCVEYLRRAFVGASHEGPMRVTFDRRIRGMLAREWQPELTGEGTALLPEKVVCEFKFRGVLPSLLKSAIQVLKLTACGVSKYRHCLEAEGFAGRRSRHHA
jgi:hypothetical protein